MYCGDDVSSVVFDMGSYQVRSGYSGEDVPRSILPSNVGVLLNEKGADVEMEASEAAPQKRQGIIVGQSEVGHRRDNMDVQNIFDSDGLLRFEYLDAIIEQSLLTNLRVNITETPILFTENAIHNKE